MKKKLLMEGNNDMYVAANAWLRIVGTDPKDIFKIVNCDGIGNMPEHIRLRMKEGNEVLGVVLDADEDVIENWKKIKKIFEEFGAQIPDVPERKGFINAAPPTKIGIWVMPDNHLPGKIEHFLQMLIPSEDQLKNEVDNVLNDIESKNKHKYEEKDRPKAIMHTWLAWQRAPGQPYGKAIEMKYLSTDTQVCKDFVTWLKNLFL